MHPPAGDPGAISNQEKKEKKKDHNKSILQIDYPDPTTGFVCLYNTPCWALDCRLAANYSTPVPDYCVFKSLCSSELTVTGRS